MSCFPCFSSQRSKKSSSGDDQNGLPGKDKGVKVDDIKHINAQTYTFRELATATKNFRQECLLGEGGFGRVYKGTFKSTGQVVAVKQLDRSGINGNKEFLSEVLTLSLLHHPNLVNLLGYCADGDQRLLVFEYMYGGSLEDHLLDIRPDKNPLDWFTRIRIALGIATGLEYLHETASPPVIYRDLKSSNILLDDDLNPKLSDFGGANLGLPGEKANVSSRAMGTYGYSAPEYTRTGLLTLKSDIYSYGVVLLELITGRRAIDTTRPNDEQNLVTWAQSFFRDPKKYPDLADPLLDGQFPEKDLNQAVAITAMCLQDEATARPLISDVVMTLSFLSTKPAEPVPAPTPTPAPAPAPAPAPKLEGENSNHRDADNKTRERESESSDEESENSEYYEDVHASSTSHKSSDSGSGDESDTSTRSGSTRKSSSGSNRPDSPGGEIRAYARSSTMGSATNNVEGLSMSRRTTRMLSAPASVSGRRTGGVISVPRNDSEVSLGMMSACHEHSYSFGSQDGFVSLQNISSIGSSEGSVHSHLQ